LKKATKVKQWAEKAFVMMMMMMMVMMVMIN
jgi:hypothetical protein